MLATAERRTVFKRCTVCEKTWHSIRDLVTDPALRLDGYQACFARPEMGLLLVTHEVPCCGTTLALVVRSLRPLYDGPKYTERRTGEEKCRGYCLKHNILEECDVDCELAWVRSVIQWLRNHELPPHILNREDI